MAIPSKPARRRHLTPLVICLCLSLSALASACTAFSSPDEHSAPPEDEPIEVSQSTTDTCEFLCSIQDACADAEEVDVDFPYADLSDCIETCEQNTLTDDDAFLTCHAELFGQILEAGSGLPGVEEIAFCAIFGLVPDNCTSLQSECSDHCEELTERCPPLDVDDTNSHELCLTACGGQYVRGRIANQSNPLGCIRGALAALDMVPDGESLDLELRRFQACSAADPFIPSALCSYNPCEDLCTSVVLGCLDHPIAEGYGIDATLVQGMGGVDFDSPVLQAQLVNCMATCQQSFPPELLQPAPSFSFQLTGNSLACRSSNALLPAFVPGAPGGPGGAAIDVSSLCAFAGLDGGDVCSDNPGSDPDRDGLGGYDDLCPYVYDAEGDGHFLCADGVCTYDCRESYCSAELLDCTGGGVCNRTDCSNPRECGPGVMCPEGQICFDSTYQLCSGEACGQGYCPPGESCLNPDVVGCQGPPCGGDICDSSFVCVDGNCVRQPCGDITCDQGTFCRSAEDSLCSGSPCGQGFCTPGEFCTTAVTNLCEPPVPCGVDGSGDPVTCFPWVGCLDPENNVCGVRRCGDGACYLTQECIDPDTAECGERCFEEICDGTQSCTPGFIGCQDGATPCGNILCYHNATCNEAIGFCEGTEPCGASGDPCDAGYFCHTDATCRMRCGDDGTGTGLLCPENEGCFDAMTETCGPACGFAVCAPGETCVDVTNGVCQ